MAEIRNFDDVDEAIQMEADAAGETNFGSFLPQLLAFIDRQRVNPTKQVTTFFFKQDGRKGFIICNIVKNGIRMFNGPPGGGDMLNISYAAIGSVDPTTPMGTDTKHVLSRLCDELLQQVYQADTPGVKGIRIEAILSPEWNESLGTRGWVERNKGDCSRMLLKGGKSKKRKIKSKRRKSFKLR
jgi:hypothetical protein